MSLGRVSGILLHPTSLPSPYGVGDLGPEAFRFLDWLATARQKLWQILPLGPTDGEYSPYQALSALAGNEMLISPEQMIADSLADHDLVNRCWEESADKEGFARALTFREKLLTSAAAEFGSGHPLYSDWLAYQEAKSYWLRPYARFRALREANDLRAWLQWDKYVKSDLSAVDDIDTQLASSIHRVEFSNWVFDRQWAAVARYAADRGIVIVGDIPIYVSMESADVWSHPELFQLDENRRPLQVAGVPPDYFSETGQLWNNPLFDWGEMEQRGFAWWQGRVARVLEQVDLARIDHFRGFAGYWSVPYGEETAVNGEWMPGPGGKLFDALRRGLEGKDYTPPTADAQLPFIAEDLGYITEDVHDLRRQFGLPGMQVLQFLFGEDAVRPFAPDMFESNTILYTGTHDNDTALGWYDSVVAKDKGLAGRLAKVMPVNRETFAWNLTELAWKSSPNVAITQLQDVLNLGAKARMNRPGTTQAQHVNWQWRLCGDALKEEVAKALAEMTERHGRCG